ncbi:MAG TPA: ice-binding family protein [Candidatus Limnocylindrales bacterium]
MDIKVFAPHRAAIAVLILGIATAGCANGGAGTTAVASPTATVQPSQGASASPTPLDSAALSEIVVTDPTNTAQAASIATPTTVGSTGGNATLAAGGGAAAGGGSAAGPASVSLGTAGNYVLLSKAGISTTGTTKITGDIGVSPIAASAITGFGLVLDKSGAFSRSSVVVGKVLAADYAVPTPRLLTTAVMDMQTAYTDAAGRKAGVTELGAGNLGGLTLAPGVYKWSSNVTIPTNVTLSGGKNDVWIFQIAGNLSTSSAKQVILAGGAQAKNVFWQVAGSTTLGTTSTFNGTILDKTNIALKTGAVLNGRALAQTAITLDANIRP